MVAVEQRPLEVGGEEGQAGAATLVLGCRRPCRQRLPPSPFRRFNSSPEVIRLVAMMYVRYPLSLRTVEDLLAERGVDVSYETYAVELSMVPSALIIFRL